MGVVACLLLKGVNSLLTGRVSLVDPFSIEDMLCVYLTGVAIDCCYREAASLILLSGLTASMPLT